MRHRQQSSGDLVADRRAEHAAGFAADGEHAAAAELMEQALELVPHWTAGWNLLGDYRAEAGDRGGAAAAYRELQRLDVAGIFGAPLKLAACGAAPMPAGGAAPYVAALFDDYARRFESELVGGLNYEGPKRLMQLLGPILAAGPRPARTLDLGCGTGLMGMELWPLTDELEGIDLAPAMIAEAGRKGVYTRLAVAELREHLAQHAGGLDLIVAADVLNYCGALPPVFAAVTSRLAPAGLFAFTLEQNMGAEPMVLQSSLRYAHSIEATRAACADAGLAVLALESAPLRNERGVPLLALYGVVRKA